VFPFPVTANVVPIAPILLTLIMATLSSQTSVTTRATRRIILEDDILQNLNVLGRKKYYKI
jgi:hypothetical protein